MKLSNHGPITLVLAMLVFAPELSSPTRAATMGYWKFQEGDAGTVASSIQSDVHGAELFGAASGQAGGKAPHYSTDVPGKTIRDGENGPIINDNNTSSLSFTGGSKNSGGIVSIEAQVGSEFLLQAKSFTLEAFVKTGKNQRFGVWFCKEIAKSGSGWSVGPDWKDGMVSIRVSDLRQQFNQYRNTDIASKAALNSHSLWHHIAITFDDSIKTMTFFEDYQPVGKLTVPPDFEFQYDDGNLNMGNAVQGSSYTGLMDEVRLSDKVLTPDEFLRAE